MSEPSKGHATGSAEHLVTMANDIADYFRSQGREAAIAGIATHLQRYWTPRMQAKLNAYLAQGHSGLDELPRAAVARLNQKAAEGSKSNATTAEGSKPTATAPDDSKPQVLAGEENKPTATTDQDIGRPGPWREGRYQQAGQPLDQSVRPTPGAVPNADQRPSTPVTRRDYEFPGQQVHKTEDGKDAEPPGGDAG